MPHSTAGFPPDPLPPSDRRYERLALALVLLLAGVLLTRDFTEPWMGPPDFNGAVFSSAARNHVRYGPSTTRLGVALNDSPVAAAELVYYVSHPPLVPALVALSFAVFGEREWAARLVPILSTLGCVFLLFGLGARLGGGRVGLLAALLFALFPMTIVYGEMVAHEAPTAFFMLATTAGYVEWRRSGRDAWLWVACGAFVLGALSGWPAYYVGALIPLHHAWASRRGPGRPDPRPFVLPLLALGLFGLHLAHASLLVGESGLSQLFSAFQRRATGTPSPGEVPLGGPVAFAALWARRARDLFTAAALLLVPIGAWVLYRRRHTSRPVWVPVLLAGAGALHLAVFRQGAWVHPYWAFYLGPPIALLGAVGLARLEVDGRRAVAAVLIILLVALGAEEGIEGHRGENPALPELGERLNERTSPAEALLANRWWVLLPTVRHYARRDSRGPRTRGHWHGYGEISDSTRLREVLGAHPGDSLAFVSVQGVTPGIDAWLGARYPSQGFDVRGTRYRVYHIRPRVGAGERPFPASR